jgi:hypothetical protein
MPPSSIYDHYFVKLLYKMSLDTVSRPAAEVKTPILSLNTSIIDSKLILITRPRRIRPIKRLMSDDTLVGLVSTEICLYNAQLANCYFT